MAQRFEQKVVFGENQLEQMRSILHGLRDRTHAHSLILVDPVGLPVIWLSQVTDSEVMSLSTLAAGGFAAASEMPRFIRPAAAFSGCYYEGADCHIYMLTIAEGFLLIAAYDKQVRLGPVRLFARQVAEDLMSIIGQAVQTTETTIPERQIEPGFAVALADELDLLFGALEGSNG